MKRFFYLVVVCAVLGVPALGQLTFTKAQTVLPTCTSTSATCAVTVASTTAHSVIVIAMEAANQTNQVITGVDDGGSSWSACTGSECRCADTTNNNSSTDMYYTLDSVGGKTSITVTRTATAGAWKAWVGEFTHSAGVVTYDKGGTQLTTSAVTPVPGVGLSLGAGTVNDLIVTVVRAPSITIQDISSPYTFSDHSGAFAWAYKLDATSGTAPTWTPLTGTSTGCSSALAIRLAAAATVADPTVDNGTATYNNTVTVTPSDSTSGATICYTNDGATPAATTAGTCDSDGHTNTYSTPLSVTATATVLKFLGTKTGETNSSVVTETYTLTNATPTDSPGAGSYGTAQSVTLSTTTTGGSIVYSLSGTPNCSGTGTTYSGAISISTTATLKAIACKTNYNDSSVLSSLYTISGAAAVPVHSQVY